ncbi:unnamed protein product [Paramecium sonneborni]|uniref:Uncharacterized protein n=1 Tax=Paramecium sonneborni TaxID=65129 RepID=A0A8S1QI75_9CILI|nr:unnamed protein product [Paramecium sonneborni]
MIKSKSTSLVQVMNAKKLTLNILMLKYQRFYEQDSLFQNFQILLSSQTNKYKQPFLLWSLMQT